MPVPPAVKVADQFGNPVPGVAVTFAVTAGGGSVTGATQQTNAGGVATVGAWTLGNIAGPQSLVATFLTGVAAREQVPEGTLQNAEVTVSFAATAIAGNPGAISLNAGNGQTAVAGTAVGTAPSVKVVDANGNPVNNAAVTFLVVSGGGALTGASTTTNGSGIATVGSWTLGNIAGANTLAATAAGVSGIVSISATGVAGAAANIAIANPSANGQSAAAGSPVVIAPAVRITDSRGNTVAGINVTFAVTGGGGAITGAAATSNAEGLATAGSWTLGVTAGANTLAASSGALTGSPVVFTATGTAGAPGSVTIVGGNAQTAIAGTPVSIAPSVRVADQHGNPVAGASVTFSVVAGNGTLTGATVLSNASGIATLGSWTLGPVSGVNTLGATSGSLTPALFTATGVAGAAARIEINAGNNQSAPIATTVAIAPSVKITDVNGNPVAGAAVAFAVATGGGSLTDGSATSNAAGIATLGSWTLGTTVGANTLNAASGTLTGSPVTFNATATAGAPGIITKESGDTQSAIAGSDVAVAPSVKVTTVGLIPLPGVTVTFAVVSGGGSVTSAAAVTNASGVATVGAWKLGTAVGPNTLSATVSGLSPVIFSATGTVGSAALIAINAGNNQSATTGANVAIAPSVKVTDGNGNVVSGAGVTFAVVSGGGSVTAGTPTTNASGVAVVGSWTLGSTAGPNTLGATLNGVSGASVTFSATGVAIPPLVVTLGAQRERGQTVTVTVTQGGVTLAPSAYTLALVPADGGTANPDGTVKLLKTGLLAFNATSPTASGSTSITVAQPPLVVFDMFSGGVRHIWRVAIDGGDLLQLTNTGSDNQHPSQVGDKLVYASARNGKTFDIWSMAVSTGVETQITNTAPAENDPSLSPDGLKLSFVSLATGLSRVMHSDANGGGVAAVADNTANTGSIEATPSWSPQSDKVIFSSTSARGDMDLWITTTLGGVAARLAAPANAAPPASSAELSAVWSNANAIAFLSNRSGANEVWLSNVAGTAAAKLTDGSSPTWLADGRLVFVRTVGGVGTMYWIDLASPGTVNPIAVGGGSAQRPSAVR